MIIRYLFLAAMVFLMASIPGTAAGQIKLTWKVVNYGLRCTLPADYSSDRGMGVTATLILKNQSDRPYNRVTLRLNEKAKVSAVTAAGSAVDFAVGEEKLTETQKLQRVQIRIPAVAPGEQVAISLDYKIEVSENTGLNALSPIGSQFLPFSFWYPTPTSWYFTEGPDFAPVDISVKGLGSRKMVAAGIETDSTFSNKLNGMPFFITGKWDVTENEGVSVYAPANKFVNASRTAEMASVAAKAKNYFESRLKRTFESPIRIVSTSRGSGFSDSGVIFLEAGAFQTRTLDSKTVVTIAESVAKTFLGNVIEVRGQGWGVVREGLARFLSNEFIESEYGPDTAKIVRLRQLSSYAAIADKDGPLSIISAVDGYFYSATGNKGAMVWNFLHKKYSDDFFALLTSSAEDGELRLSELRSAFSGQQDYLDQALDRVTTTNLMIGNPQSSGGVTRSALRNMGDFGVEVRVVANDAAGKKYEQSVSIPANGFSEARFETASVKTVEVDPDKLYTQTSYNDDIAPREITENDPLVFIKKEFDRQKYSDSEKNAKVVLERYGNFDEARVLLARSYLAEGKLSEARLEFEKVLAQTLATPQSIGWSVYGLGEIARRSGDSGSARNYFDEAIRANTEYGTTLAARRGRAALPGNPTVDADVKAFFTRFDEAIVANSKSAVEAVLLKGEIARFASNVAGQAQSWQTSVTAVDEIDSENILVETNLSIKLLNREIESGLAVFRLSRVGGELRISGVEIFEVG